jgi:Putative peptidoglycan binding domain/Curli production assembly/transport component CsgG
MLTYGFWGRHKRRKWSKFKVSTLGGGKTTADSADPTQHLYKENTAMTIKPIVAALSALLALSACTSNQPVMGSQEAKTVATGSAGGSNTSNASTQLERCASPFGTVALVENTGADWYRYISSEYRLTSTVPVLRLLIQQSNCFIVVERGRAMANMQQERALQNSGELRDGSSFGKGQMVSADYSITPEVLISAKGTSGMGGALGAVGGRWGAALGAVAGGIRTNEAATMLMLTDNRSGVQVSAAEGSASNTDFNIGALLVGSQVGAGMGGYTNTPQGKVIAAAFTDSYNQMVRALRNYKPQTIAGQNLGTGGKLAVDGAPRPAAAPAPVASAPAPVVAAAPMSINTLRDAQSRLNQLGYDVGAPDGQLGKRTVDQLRAFQRDRRIPITGALDNTTRTELAR